MSLYRAKPADGVAWVTGASGGIGHALALELAGQGYRVAVSARSADKLDALAAASGGRITAFPVDVTDEAAVADVVSRIESELGPIALAVLNAGTALPSGGDRLQPTLFERIYSVNVFGVVRCLAPLLERMRTRGQGQVAIVGSLTAYFGLPSTAAYGSTKAALNTIAESFRYDLEPRNIRIQIINPGFVDTPMVSRNRFPMPGLMPASAAARRIAAGLKSGGFEITFPRRLAWPVKLIRLLPASAIHWLFKQGLRRSGVPPTKR